MGHRRIVREFERLGKIGSHKRFKSIVHKFRAFTGAPLAFDEITPRLLRAYETHLVEHYRNSANTISANLKGIRTILYRAIRDGLLPQEKNPFFQFKIKNVRPARGKLTLGELKAIEELNLDEGSLVWHVRNYFLFSFYCAGIRFGDLAKLRRGHVVDGRLEYRMGKTQAGKSIKLLPQARAILARYPAGEGEPEAYLFPILAGYDASTPRRLLNAISSQNALVNKYLKKIAKQAGVRCKLSFHISRHSFADIARQRGWDVYTISKALGHANIRVTETYLKGFDTEALDEKMDTLFQ